MTIGTGIQGYLFRPAHIVQATPEIEAALQSGSPIAMGVSGGKDSCALAFAVNEYLDAIDHSGPRLLIHSDLGRTEWKDSLPICERLARTLNLELVVVRREAGDMLSRWQQRWRANVRRYARLLCVKLILPWSTPRMRFCTSEMKTKIICRYLVGRFPGQTILSAIGIRREEGPGRKKKPVVKKQKELFKQKARTHGYDWHPIIDWSREEVLSYLAQKGFQIHEAYRIFGSSRVSCAFCIMASQNDLRAAASCADHHDLYREMVAIEIESTFAFQSNGWLGDIAPHLLSSETSELLAEAKIRAARRESAEARIPKHLQYSEGWPTCVPTKGEAEMLCEVRKAVADAVGLVVEYTEPAALIGRYEELIAKRAA